MISSMIPNTFFDNFALLTDSPNAVAKLREIVLQLAVRGKLTTQNSTDEPASVLVEKSRIERDNFISNSKIRKNNLMPPIKEDEIPYQLPQAWEWSRFNDVVFSQEGPGIRNWQFRDTGVKLLNVKNIVKGKLVLENSDKHISEEEFSQKYSHFLIEDGDLLFASSGNSWGKTAFFKNPGYRVIVNTSTIRMRFWLKECNNNYLRYFLDCNIFTNQMLTQLQGMQPNFGSSHLVKVFLPLPPLAEQERIVEKCDRLLILCDEIEKRQQQRQESLLKMNEGAISQLLTAQNPNDFQHRWQRICNNFDLLYSIPETIPKLRQAILQLAVQGKLVLQNPNDEPASVLLKKVQAAIKELIKAKKIRKIEVNAVDLEGETHTLPSSWLHVRLGSILHSIKYGTSKKCDYDVPGIPVLRIPNIDVNAGEITIDDLKFTTLTDAEIRELSLIENDLLMIRSNGSKTLIGRTALIDRSVSGYAYAGYLVRVRLFPEYILAKYLHLALSTSFIREQIEFPIRTTSGVKNINSTEISNLLLPLPPLAEQKRIVAKVESLLSLCDALEAKLKAARDSSATLIEVAARQVLAV
ncbi:restriction endonuclease subunit S [Leptolyngbya sp. FACHB-321]|uniref:restriction endonuclease subunit S n=1 Tax=Leptolyngbya sp. FACHB-321 TaxID=2692807 RepID=UPI0016886589|nr:restriction endonuclease subunit S [Leptolyngbya sp. FACHB-321]MBD2033628.1 restriction endonuclease subunit S [Leptolyngbya sp. FACHB-321]